MPSAPHMPLFAARRAVSRRLAAVKIEQAAFEVEKWRAQKLTCQRIDSNVTAHRIELTSKFRILDYFCLVFSSEVFQLLLEDCALLFQLHTISCLRRRKKKCVKLLTSSLCSWRTWSPTSRATAWCINGQSFSTSWNLQPDPCCFGRFQAVHPETASSTC